MLSYEFGKNWKSFAKKIDDRKIDAAKKSLSDFLQMQNLRKKNFLDIGCGPGLFSYAAFLLKAKKVVSFDLDKNCVECCKQLHEKAGKPKNWGILQGSVLDKHFVSKLGKFDIVYAWGTLHHTGKMFEAIKNSAALVKNNGYLYIAVYNKKTGFFGSEFWLKIKKLYNSSPRLLKKMLKLSYIFYFFISNVCYLQNPIAKIKKYDSNRGMSWLNDVDDWLGGYPYEFASQEEIINFLEKECSELKLVKTKTTKSTGNNEYLFKKEK